MNRAVRTAIAAALIAACVSLSGCNANIGVGLNVRVPIGDYGYMSVGTGRRHWY